MLIIGFYVTFSEKFKKSCTNPPKKYIMEKRLLLTGKKINEGEKPTTVFEERVFFDYTTFFLNYLSFFGHIPSKK